MNRWLYGPLAAPRGIGRGWMRKDRAIPLGMIVPNFPEQFFMWGYFLSPRGGSSSDGEQWIIKKPRKDTWLGVF